MSLTRCPECPNRDPLMFSNAAGGKKHLCMKCYHSFYKPGDGAKEYYSSPGRRNKALPIKTIEVPDTVFIEINILRERLNKLEEFCKKRGIIQ